MGVSRALKSFLPPPLLDCLRPRIRFSGDWRSWGEAQSASSGYGDSRILEKVSAAMDEVLAGRAAFERDSVAFKEHEFNWPLVAALLLAAGRLGNARPLSVLDFGGSLGSSYCQNRRALPKGLELNWMVVEQPAFAKRGSERFSNSELAFSSSLGDCAKPDILLLCSVLPYLPEPWKSLDELLRLAPGFIFIDRTPMREASGEDRLCVQSVPASICRASYPAWMLSRRRLSSVIGDAGYKEAAAFVSMGGSLSLSSPPEQVVERGCIWERPENSLTEGSSK